MLRFAIVLLFLFGAGATLAQTPGIVHHKYQFFGPQHPGLHFVPNPNACDYADTGASSWTDRFRFSNNYPLAQLAQLAVVWRPPATSSATAVWMWATIWDYDGNGQTVGPHPNGSGQIIPGVQTLGYILAPNPGSGGPIPQVADVTVRYNELVAMKRDWYFGVQFCAGDGQAVDLWEVRLTVDGKILLP